MTADEPAPMDETPNETMDEGGHQEQPTAFLSKEMGGGKVWKPGDEIVLVVKAVDPETGELQVAYAPEKPGEGEGEGEGEEPTDSMSAMDKTFPAGGEGDY